jgi:hypothetical protein
MGRWGRRARRTALSAATIEALVALAVAGAGGVVLVGIFAG